MLNTPFTCVTLDFDEDPFYPAKQKRTVMFELSVIVEYGGPYSPQHWALRVTDYTNRIRPVHLLLSVEGEHPNLQRTVTSKDLNDQSPPPHISLLDVVENGVNLVWEVFNATAVNSDTHQFVMAMIREFENRGILDVSDSVYQNNKDNLQRWSRSYPGR